MISVNHRVRSFSVGLNIANYLEWEKCLLVMEQEGEVFCN